MRFEQRLYDLALLAHVIVSTGCSARIPDEARASNQSPTTVRYDPTTPLLRDVPWPNDSLCWTRTNQDKPCLPNIPVTGTSSIYADWIASINETHGWSTTGVISLPIARASDAFSGPAIDISRLLAAQHDSDFSNDALYVIDLDSELPVLLDFENNLTSFVLQTALALDPSDPHRDAPSLILETDDERYDAKSHKFDSTRTSDGTVAGTPVYETKWDRDSDGRLDVPVYERGQHCVESSDDTATARAAHARCLADNLVPFYDPVDERLRIRPRAPLREHTTYAVVVTDRLLDNRERPLGSPFATVYHPLERSAAKRVEAILSNPARDAYYGSLAGTGLQQVRFLFTFTTASPVAELRKSAGTLDARTLEHVEYLDEVNLDDTCEEKTLRDVLVAHLSDSLGFFPGEREALRDDLANVASLRTGRFTHPSYVVSNSETLRLRQTPGTESVTVPFLITIPRETARNQVVPVAIVNHDVQTNRLDGLRSAGQWARFGLSALLYDRLGAVSPLDTNVVDTLRKTATEGCSKGLSHALLDERSDASFVIPGPLSYDIVSTRDRWRASGIELWSLSRLLSNASNTNDSVNGSLPTKLLGYIGQGEGAAIAGIAATLPGAPKTLVVIDPTTSPARAWARGTSWGTPSTTRYQLFGPRIAGVAASVFDSTETTCKTSESSLRLLSSARDYPGKEVGCLSLVGDNGSRFPNGATVFVLNARSGDRRCVSMTNLGEFSLGIPAQKDDPFELIVYPGIDVVQRFGRNDDCTLVAQDSVAAYSLTIKSEASPIITTGLGLERQSAEFRVALDWADAAFGLANPNAFFAELGHATPGTDAIATLIVVSPGNPTASPDEGLSVAVSSGLIPHLPAESLLSYATLASDTTPTLLASSLRQPTAELAISRGHLAEGAPWLMRHDPAPLSCGVNRVAATTLPEICQPSCESTADCPQDTTCIDDTCQAETPSAELCAESLYDADHLAGDLTGTNAESAVYPLRLGRYSGTTSPNNLATLWQPRTIDRDDVGAPSPLHPNWPFVALALPLVHPRGSHGLPSDDLCERYRFGTYVPNLLARFLTTQGRDFSPVLDWSEQTCLSDPKALSTCGFFTSP